LDPILRQAGLNTIDVSHVINHISFGDDSDIKEIMKKFNKGVLNPLDNVKKIKGPELKTVGVMHQYYINVVPSTYEDIKGR